MMRQLRRSSEHELEPEKVFFAVDIGLRLAWGLEMVVGVEVDWRYADRIGWVQEDEDFP